MRWRDSKCFSYFLVLRDTKSSGCSKFRWFFLMFQINFSFKLSQEPKAKTLQNSILRNTSDPNYTHPNGSSCTGSGSMARVLSRNRLGHVFSHLVHCDISYWPNCCYSVFVNKTNSTTNQCDINCETHGNNKENFCILFIVSNLNFPLFSSTLIEAFRQPFSKNLHQ